MITNWLVCVKRNNRGQALPWPARRRPGSARSWAPARSRIAGEFGHVPNAARLVESFAYVSGRVARHMLGLARHRRLLHLVDGNALAVRLGPAFSALVPQSGDARDLVQRAGPVLEEFTAATREASALSKRCDMKRFDMQAEGVACSFEECTEVNG